MKNIKNFDQYNEELNIKKAIAGGALGLGLLAGGGAYVHDKIVEPTEINQTRHTDLPDSFEMKQKVLTFGTDMYVTNNNKDNFGMVKERTMHLTSTFEYYDNTGKLIAKAHKKLLSLFTVIEIYDENNKFIGSVEKEIIESLMKPMYSVYSIKDANNKIIAKSDKLSLFTTNVELYGSYNGETIAKFHKNFISAPHYHNWEIQINGNIDKRLIIFIPSFITSAQSNKK